MKTNHEMVRTWTGDDCAWTPWTADAQHGTVMIDATADGAVAIVLEDAGAPSYHGVATDQVPVFLAAVMQAWSRLDRAGVVAVLWRHRFAPVIRGRVPGPPPWPIIGDDAVAASAWLAHQVLEASIELAARRARHLLGD